MNGGLSSIPNTLTWLSSSVSTGDRIFPLMSSSTPSITRGESHRTLVSEGRACSELISPRLLAAGLLGTTGFHAFPETLGDRSFVDVSGVGGALLVAVVRVLDRAVGHERRSWCSG